jgi:hypothetical protein
VPSTIFGERLRGAEVPTKSVVGYLQFLWLKFLEEVAFFKKRANVDGTEYANARSVPETKRPSAWHKKCSSSPFSKYFSFFKKSLVFQAKAPLTKAMALAFAKTKIKAPRCQELKKKAHRQVKNY